MIVSDPFCAGDELPEDIRAFQTLRASEVAFCLPQQGAGAKPNATDEPLRLCPERRLGTGTHADLRALLELPVERVLVSHGAPVLRGGAEALAALARLLERLHGRVGCREL